MHALEAVTGSGAWPRLVQHGELVILKTFIIINCKVCLSLSNTRTVARSGVGFSWPYLDELSVWVIFLVIVSLQLHTMYY